jgi:predicted transcriptional regulator of viral defense system
MTNEDSKYARVLELSRQKGIVSRSDLRDEGLTQEYLSRMSSQGLLSALAPGVYVDPDAETDEFFELAVVAKRVPDAIFFGPSALMFHGVTTQVAHSVHLAIERGRWTPRLEWPTIEVVHLSGRSYSTGIEEHTVAPEVPIRVYSVAKTVADLFKFRSRFGLDVAIEALKEGWRERLFTREELEECARASRVHRVMMPYMEML